MSNYNFTSLSAIDVQITIDEGKNQTFIIPLGSDSVDGRYTGSVELLGSPAVQPVVFVTDEDFELQTPSDPGTTVEENSLLFNVIGNKYSKGEYKGLIQSDNKDNSVFFKCNLTIKIV